MTAYTDDLTQLVLDSCFYCGGLWFDRGELRTLFTSPKLAPKFLFPTATFRVKIKNAPEKRLCCRCENCELSELQVNGVNIDECKECEGIWLDAGEIMRLLEIHSKGKFDAKCETTSQIKWGKFDKTALGQVARMVMLAFRKLLHL